MDAGRELDALIAEKVMGTFIPAGSNPSLRDDAWLNERGYLVWEPPPYSTDIAAAWLVVEKLKQSYDIVDILFANHYVSCKVWKDFMIAEEDAETAPLAICLAALKAVGHSR